MDRTTLKTTVYLIKKGLQQQSWWILVQTEVKKHLNFIIDNIDVMGKDFKDAFMSFFRLEHARRVLQHEALDISVTGVFLGLTEECYQSSILPAKSLLALEEWVVPKDSDILAIMHLCQQIEVLENNGLFVIDPPESLPAVEKGDLLPTEETVPKSFFQRIFARKK